jgi:hypothetical protein
MGSLVRDVLVGLFYAGVALFATFAWRSLKGANAQRSRVIMAWGGACGGLVAAVAFGGRVASGVPGVPASILALLLSQWFFVGFTLGTGTEMIYRRTLRKGPK